MEIAARQPFDFLAFVQMYSICHLNGSFSSTITPRIFYSLTCFITESFTMISILELFLLFSNRMTCVFLSVYVYPPFLTQLDHYI